MEYRHPHTRVADSRRLMGENGLSLLNLESRFYAVLSKLPKWPSVKSTLIEVPGTETAKRPECSTKQKSIESPNENSQGQSLRCPGIAALPNEGKSGDQSKNT